ncbi:hypothetical protein ACFYMX_15715 [Streptomyces griseofuscus]|uniref:hypothetical protein n=1 Tax=Streptomyces griseofuscus TaxID=146922 RepID=UPI0036B55FCE
MSLARVPDAHAGQLHTQRPAVGHTVGDRRAQGTLPAGGDGPRGGTSWRHARFTGTSPYLFGRATALALAHQHAGRDAADEETSR